MKEISLEQLNGYYGQGVTIAAILSYLMIAAGIVGVYKILMAPIGKLKITGITFQWGK